MQSASGLRARGECSSSGSSHRYSGRQPLRSPTSPSTCRHICRSSDAAGDGPSLVPDTMPMIGADGDWREFRARLVAGSRATSVDGAPRPSASAAACASTTTAAPSTAAEGADGAHWAHSLPTPEKGALLLAHPQMFASSQTYFQFAVVLLLDHDAVGGNGSFGVILNKPTDMALRDVVMADTPLSVFPDNRLYLGGDVGDSQIVILTQRADVPDAIPVMGGVSIVNLRAAEAAVRTGRASPSDFRFYLKYAGWGPGQLAGECARGVWYTVAASAGLALTDDAAGSDMWHTVLQAVGGDHAKVSDIVRLMEVRQQAPSAADGGGRARGQAAGGGGGVDSSATAGGGEGM